MTAPLQSAPSRIDFQIWSTTATLVTTDPLALPAARAGLDAELLDIEMACSRFRSDSEISRLLRNPGKPVRISAVLNDAMSAALRIAAATANLVDPTVAAAVIALGYDRDIRLLADRELELAGLGTATAAARPAPGAWRIEHDPDNRLLTVPTGVGIDLGATAKALAADRAAIRIAGALGCGVLVGLGGDIAVAGEVPAGGWTIAIADDHRLAESAPQTKVAIAAGGLATSSIAARTWHTPSGTRHHLVDPRTGENPTPYWRTVSAAAGSAVDANAASTAAIILGEQAGAWLTAQRIPSRLVSVDGNIQTLAGWPDDERRAA